MINMKDKLSEQIGLRLKAARRAANYKSARAFAARHGISISTYSQHEMGLRSLKPKLLLRYSELLGVSPHWLLTG
jgi:transcriptional regulator with XRE-family HTH domain